MGENSKIGWVSTPNPDGTITAGHTQNFWMGCTKVSPACAHCYAEVMMDHRYGKVKWGKGEERVVTSEANWKKPFAWDRKAAKTGTRPKVFCSSLADIFDDEVEPQWQRDAFEIMEATPHLDWLLLTKRPELVHTTIPEHWWKGMWPANVWLGVTVENQKQADLRIPILLENPAPVRFLSCEPLLGPINLRLNTQGVPCTKDGHPIMTLRDEMHGEKSAGIDWLICGGESGRAKNVRPMHPMWVYDLRNQCELCNPTIPFFFKQWGEFKPIYTDTENFHLKRLGTKNTGHDLDGKIYQQFPTPKNRCGNLYCEEDP